MPQQTELDLTTKSRNDLIRISEVCQIAGGVSAATIYRWIADERFPGPYKPTTHTSLWKRGEIEDWKIDLSRLGESDRGAA